MYKLFRTLLLPVAALFAFTAATAQNVSWKSSVEHLEGDVYRIVLEASIPAPYHMYDMGPYEGGPNATAIVFTPGDGVTLEGGVEQLSTPERHYDKTFEMEIGTFARSSRPMAAFSRSFLETTPSTSSSLPTKSVPMSSVKRSTAAS